MPKRPASSPPPGLQGSVFKCHFSSKEFTTRNPSEMAKIYEKTLRKLKEGRNQSSQNSQFSCVSCFTGKRPAKDPCSSCRGITCIECPKDCGNCEVKQLCGNCSISTPSCTLCLNCAHE